MPSRVYRLGARGASVATPSHNRRLAYQVQEILMHTNRCQRLLASTSHTDADHLIVEMTGDDGALQTDCTTICEDIGCGDQAGDRRVAPRLTGVFTCVD